MPHLSGENYLFDEAIGRFVNINRAIRVILENGARNRFGLRAFEKVIDGFGFVLAGGDQDDLSGVHDGLQTHGDRFGRNLRDIVEQTGVVLDGGFGELRDVGQGIKWGARLVEGDVAIAADAKDLEIDAAEGGDLIIILIHVSDIIANAFEDVGFGLIDIDMIEEVIVHEITIGLVMGALEADVFVEVEGGDVFEADASFFVGLHHIGVDLKRGGSGGKAQDGIRLGVDLLDEFLRDQFGDVIFISNNDFHVFTFLLSRRRRDFL